MLAKQLSGAAAAAVPAYIEDVFSTYLYTGSGATQTINNGIDLAGKGGLVWIKTRNLQESNALNDTARGANKVLRSDTTGAESSPGYGEVLTFNSNGFSGTLTGYVAASSVIWTFRKAPKFFDVVTYTGTGTPRTVAHSLGSVPGCIIIKRTSGTEAGGVAGWWIVYHSGISTPQSNCLFLNTTDSVNSATVWNNTAPTATAFTVNNNYTNFAGDQYVAYLFAHNAGGFGEAGTENVISCGSYTGTGAAGNNITLGYEPQWLMIKNASGTGNWQIIDNMRGMPVGSADATLKANLSNAESSVDYVSPTATGFQVTSTSTEVNTNAATYIYIAIRRGPMKTPTDATKVFQPTVYTGTNVDNRLVDTTIAPDMVFVRQRNDTALGGMVVGDRLRAQPYLLTGTTAAEVDDADAFDRQIVSTTEYGTAFSAMNGFWCGNDATAKLNANTTSNNHIAEAFKRAPGFFDVVCYTGDGVAGRTVNHNLGVAPELMIVKNRSSASTWYVYPNDNNARLSLNATSALSTPTSIWNTTSPTSTVFTVGSLSDVNGSGNSLVAYLFASCPGVSKVGSYTGSGTTKQIDCGFTGGARFVLIKRTDSTGDWYVWDSARGIVAGNDPYLLLNSTAAEVTTTDYIDTYAQGFEISSTAPAAINANGGTFVFLAVA